MIRVRLGPLLCASLFVPMGGTAFAAGSSYIQTVEEQLQQLGYAVGEIDGVFDQALEAGLNAFKADAGRPQDGLLDRETRSLIEARVKTPRANNPDRATDTAAGTTPPPAAPSTTTVVRSQPAPTIGPVTPSPADPADAEPATDAATHYAQATRRPAVFGDPAWRAERPTYRRRIGWIAEIAAEFGGDELVTVTLDNNEREDITAGDGLSLAGGGYWLLRPDFGVQGLLGYKLNESSAADSDLGVDRWTLEASAFTFLGDVQLTAGVVHHRDINFDGDGFLPDFSFDDATGLKLDAAWRWFALSYTQIDYEVNGFRFDAGSIGLRLRGGF